MSSIAKPSLSRSEHNQFPIDVLRSYKLLPRNGSFEEIKTRLSFMSVQKLLRIMEGLERAKAYGFTPHQSRFTFIGTRHLSGGPLPCSNPSCRLSTVDALGRFAGLYADHVYLPNPFHDIDHYSRLPENDLYREVFTAVATLHHLHPLLEAGIVSFIDHTLGGICSDCYSKAWNEIDASRKAPSQVTDYVIGKYIKEAEFLLQGFDDNGQAIIKVSAPEDIIGCGGFYHILPSPIGIGRVPNDKLPIKLNREQIGQNRLAYRNVIETVSDIRTQTRLSDTLGASYLTQRGVDFDVLKKFGNRTDSSKPVFSPDTFTHILPTIGSVGLSRLLKMRAAESEAFEVYRQALTKAMDSSKGQNRHKQGQAFNDIVRPELIKLNSAVRRSKKLLTSNVLRDVTIVTGSLAAGLITSSLPAELHGIGALGALAGGAHYSRRLIESITKLIEEPPAAINNKYYFLWKIQN